MSYAKDILGDEEYRQFEEDMTMQDLMLEYSEEDMELLFDLFGLKD